MASGRFTKTVIDAENEFGNFIIYNNDSGKSNAVTLFANSLSTSSNQVVSVVVGVATTALAGISTLFTSTGVGVGTTVAGNLGNFSGWMYNDDMTSGYATPEVSQTGVCGWWRLHCCVNNAQTGAYAKSNTCSCWGSGTAMSIPGEFVSAAGTIYSRNDLNCTATAANCCQKWGWPYCNVCTCIGGCCYGAAYCLCYVKGQYGGTEITALHLGVGNTNIFTGMNWFCNCQACAAKQNCPYCFSGIMSATAYVGVLPGFMCGCCNNFCNNVMQGPELYVVNHCHIGNCFDAKRLQLDPTGCPSSNFCKPWGAGSNPCCWTSSSCNPTNPGNPVPYNCVCCKCNQCCCYMPGGKRCYMRLGAQAGLNDCAPENPGRYGSFYSHNWYALMCLANYTNYCDEDVSGLAGTAHVEQGWTMCYTQCCPACNPGNFLALTQNANAICIKSTSPAGQFHFAPYANCTSCTVRWVNPYTRINCCQAHCSQCCHKNHECGKFCFASNGFTMCAGNEYQWCANGCPSQEKKIWCRPCCCSFMCSGCGQGMNFFMKNNCDAAISPYGVAIAMTCGAQIWLRHISCCNAVYGIGFPSYQCYCYCQCCCQDCNICNNTFVLHVGGVYDCPNTTWLAHGPDIQTYSCGDGGTACEQYAGTELPIKYFTYHPGCACHYFMVRTGPATASFCGGVHPGCGIFSVNMKCISACMQRRCICLGGACGSDTATMSNCYMSCCNGSYGGASSSQWIPLDPSGLNNHPSKDTLFGYTVPNAAGVGINSMFFCKLANFPVEWTCSYYTRPRMCVSCLFRYEHCAWSIGVYNCCTCGWDAFTSKDLVNWASLPGLVIACTDPCVYCCLRAVPACIDRCCDCFTSNMECEGMIDQCVPINQYERTGVVLSAGDKIFVKNYGASGAGKVSFQVWGYEG